MGLNTLQQHSAGRSGLNKLLAFADMTNRTEQRHKVRRSNFERVIKSRFKTKAALSAFLGEGFSPSYISQLLSGHRGIGDEVADKIESRLGLPSGYLDRQADERLPAPTTERTMILREWDYLLPDEQAKIVNEIKQKAAHNQRVMQELVPYETVAPPAPEFVPDQVVRVTDRRKRQVNFDWAERRNPEKKEGGQ